MRTAAKHLVVSNTLGTSFDSDPLLVGTTDKFSIQVNVVTTVDLPVGIFKVQTSNDGVNWVDFPSSSEAIAGVSKSIIYNVVGAAYSFARLDYTRTSGGGGTHTFCDVYVFQKGTNAE